MICCQTEAGLQVAAWGEQDSNRASPRSSAEQGTWQRQTPSRHASMPSSSRDRGRAGRSSFSADAELAPGSGAAWPAVCMRCTVTAPACLSLEVQPDCSVMQAHCCRACWSRAAAVAQLAGAVVPRAGGGESARAGPRVPQRAWCAWLSVPSILPRPGSQSQSHAIGWPGSDAGACAGPLLLAPEAAHAYPDSPLEAGPRQPGSQSAYDALQARGPAARSARVRPVA